MLAYRRWHKQRREIHQRWARLMGRMKHPGGTSCGRRWLPLAYWVGWPRSLGSWLAYIMDRESSGRERAYNPVIGCSGLLQIWPGNLHAGESAADLFHAEFNLRVGLRLYREAGTSPWTL